MIAAIIATALSAIASTGSTSAFGAAAALESQHGLGMRSSDVPPPLAPPREGATRAEAPAASERLTAESARRRMTIDVIAGRIDGAEPIERRVRGVPRRLFRSAPDGWSAWIEVEGKGPLAQEVLVVASPKAMAALERPAHAIERPADDSASPPSDARTPHQKPQRKPDQGPDAIPEPEPGSSSDSAPLRYALGPGRVSDLRWSPAGGLLVCARATGDAAQVIETLEPRRPRAALRRISPAGGWAESPAVAGDGTIAYALLRERRGKESDLDVIVRSPEGSERVVIEGAPVRSLALAPDASRLVVGLQGELELIELTQPTELNGRAARDRSAGRPALGERDAPTDPAARAVRRVWRLSEIDVAAFAHHPATLAVSSDGRWIAATIRFSGGRASGLGGDRAAPRVFGDQEIVVIDADAPDQQAPASPAVRVIKVGAEVEWLEWSPPQAREPKGSPQARGDPVSWAG